MKWTNEQYDAITCREKNILVSAAAGSGKTAVLVERIKKMIIEDGVPIDRMLIVTFTNAAAAEMKEKIRTAITEELRACTSWEAGGSRAEGGSEGAGVGTRLDMAEGGSEEPREREYPDGARDPHPETQTRKRLLQKQLALLPKANISTFDAFALKVARKYFYLIDIEPNFKICDNAQGEIIRAEALEALLEKYFDQGDEEFYQFLRWYSSDRNENNIKDMIGSTYTTLQSLPHPWEWYDEKVEQLALGTEEFQHSQVMGYIWRAIEFSLEKACGAFDSAEEILAGSGLERLASMVAADREQVLRAQEKAEARDFEGVCQGLDSFSTSRMVARKEEKPNYEPIKDEVSELRKEAKGEIEALRKNYFTLTLSEQVEELNGTYPKALFLKKMLMDFDRLFKEGKGSKNVADFNDVEHYCIDILSKEEAAQFYRDKFEAIYIDEYQDTNLLQEAIIDCIKRDNNLFMVGDLKQSIYKFRLAEPDIFKGKYKEYKAQQGQEGSLSKKIDLNKNFRSKETVINTINNVFEDLMEDYDEDAMLYTGDEYKGELLYKPRLTIVDVKNASSEDIDQELKNLRKAEYEALAARDIILENLGKTIYDSKAGEERALGLRDIVILMRSVKDYGSVFAKTLRDSGIPTYIDDSDGYFDTMEINVFMNLLSVIDNKYQDIPLISVLRSEIFDFSVQELSQIRIENKGCSYCQALINYAEGGMDANLKAKCGQVLQCIADWKERAISTDLDKFIWELLLETDYYIVMGSMPFGRQRQGNLRALVDKAIKFEESETGSLYNFMKYIEAIKKNKVSMGQVKLVGENEDIVRIMTIHKSKGLEFPAVLICGIGKRLSYSKSGKGVVFHKNLGIAMTYVNPEEHWHRKTILQFAVDNMVRAEELEEEKRVLYVAMTRAKDILEVTGTVGAVDFDEDGNVVAGSGDSSYLGMIDEGCFRCRVLPFDLVGKVRADEGVHPGGLEKPQDIGHAGSVQEDGDAEKGDIAERVMRILDYRYPYEEALTTKSKYSVTEINNIDGGGGHSYEVPLAVPNFIQGDRRLTGAEIGTVYHGIMERLDFGLAAAQGKPYIEACIEQWTDRGIFTPEEAKAVRLNRITEFFATDLGKRAAGACAAGALWKEKPFDLVKKINGEDIIVQGIIDCFFEEDGKFVLLDYKTNYIDKDKPLEEELQRIGEMYQAQVAIYREALETIKGKPVEECYLYLFNIGRSICIF